MADTPTYIDNPTATTLQATETGGLTPIMALPPRDYAEGERVLVTARLAGQSNVDKYPRMAIRVDATGAATVRGPVVSMNHDGAAYGTQYLPTRWLFIAPVAGTYTLTARAEATTYHLTDEAQITVVDGGATYLKTSEVNQNSTTFAPANDSCVGTVAVGLRHLHQPGQVEGRQRQDNPHRRARPAHPDQRPRTVPRIRVLPGWR